MRTTQAREANVLDLGIVIVNWNTRDLLERCLRTVLKSEGDFRFRIVVVDNASNDDSATMVQRGFPSVELIANPVNAGYPRANNIGLRALGFRGARDVDPSAPRYALLLNPDTEVPPDALIQMLQFMDSRPDIGVAGPKLILTDGSLDKACRRGFPTPMVSFYHYSGLAKLFNRRFGRYNMTLAMKIKISKSIPLSAPICRCARRPSKKRACLMKLFSCTARTWIGLFASSRLVSKYGTIRL